MVGGETDSSLREEIGVCATMPLVSWQQGESERDRPAQRCRELALGDKLANRCKKQQASETDTRPAPSGSVTYVAVSGGSRFPARVFE